MKQIFSALIIIISSFINYSIFGQSNFCASQNIHNQLLMNDTIINQKYLQAKNIMFNANNISNGLLANGIFNIPVVVHIIHTGDQIGTGTNPTDLQIQNYINTLNLGFSASFPGYPDTNNGGQNIKIQFQLAQRDSNCNLTNGIIRINASNDATYVSGGLGFNSYIGGISFNDIANKSFWNSNDYVNIWIVKSINGGQYAGFGFYPAVGSFFGDGVYIDYTDVIYSTDPYLIAHELGHFFDLRHTFEGSLGLTCPTNNNCLVDGDMVCDTDPSIVGINSNGCNSININPCTNSQYGSIINNY
jgi:Pregnancy-associated plasma protein-A